MFMVKKNEAQAERVEKLLKRVKALYGEVPPQMEFLGNIEVTYLEDFLQMVISIVKHPNINPDFFGFVRLHIAFREEYVYCKMYNTKFLLAKGYRQEQLNEVIADVTALPLDEKHQALGEHAVRAMYESKQITGADFKNLYAMGWSQKDVFDAIEHAGVLLKNGRILTTYGEK